MTKNSQKCTKVTLILPCHNESKALNVMLRQIVDLKKKIETRYQLEVIVIDNNSDDNSITVAKKHHTKVFKHTTRGYGSTYPIFKRYLDYDRINHQFINKGPYRSAALRLLKKKLAGFSREDIAAGVQKHLETVVLAYISDMVSCYGFGKTNLAVAGGVFANVLLNQKVSLLPTIKSLFVFSPYGRWRSCSRGGFILRLSIHQDS